MILGVLIRSPNPARHGGCVIRTKTKAKMVGSLRPKKDVSMDNDSTGLIFPLQYLTSISTYAIISTRATARGSQLIMLSRHRPAPAMESLLLITLELHAENEQACCRYAAARPGDKRMTHSCQGKVSSVLGFDSRRLEEEEMRY